MSPHSLPLVPSPLRGLGLSLVLCLAAPVMAQWRHNPPVDDALDPYASTFRDAVRLVMEDLPFAMQPDSYGRVRIQRTDIDGRRSTVPLAHWHQAGGRPDIDELVGCKIGPRDFVLAYTWHDRFGPSNVVVAKVHWDTNDQYWTAPNYPVVLSTEFGTHSLAITPRETGSGVDGVLVAWHTTIASVTRIRQQGVTGGGTLLWPAFPDGVPLESVDLGTSAAAIQKPTIISTGDGLAMTTYHMMVGGNLKHRTAKLDTNVNGTTFQYGTPRDVPGQGTRSESRCCVAGDGNGGAFYGFGTEAANLDTEIQLARVNANVANSDPWQSSSVHPPSGYEPRLRALAMLSLPGNQALLVYRDETDFRTVGIGLNSFGFPHKHVSGASALTNTDDAALAFDGTRVCVMSTSDDHLAVKAFDTGGKELWGSGIHVNNQNSPPPKLVEAMAPQWPHVFAVGPNHTQGFLMAWYDDDYFAAERVSILGKIGRWLVGPGSAAGGSVLDLPSSALSFDAVSPYWRYLVGLQIELSDSPGAAGDVEIHVATGTSRVGIEQNPAAWTLVANVPVVSAGPGNFTNVVLPTSFALPPGTNAVMVRSASLRLTSSPAVGGLQAFDLGGGTSVVCGAHVGTWPTGPLHNGRVFAGALLLEDVADLAVPASHTTYGAGCYGQSDSFYAYYPDAAAATSALNGQSVTMSYDFGTNQYVVTGGGGAMLSPGTPLSSSVFAPNADDGVALVWVPYLLPGHGTGVFLNVHTNGGIWLDNNVSSLTPNDYTPNATAMLNAPFEGFWCWHDFNLSEPGSGTIWVNHGIPGMLVITWWNVESYPLGTVNPSTIQFQLDLGSGSVTWVFQNVDANTASPYGSSYLVGWSPYGASFDAGSLDLATALPITTSVGMWPLALAASPAPIPGATIAYTTTNMAEVAPGAGLYLGFTLISLAGSPVPGGGLDLGILGAPGCPLHVQTLDIVLPLSGASPTLAVSITLPPNTPAGFTFHAQSVSLFTPGTLPNGLNSLGATISNGIASVVGF